MRPACVAVALAASTLAMSVLTAALLVGPPGAWAAVTPDLDAQVRAIAAGLRCPVCQNESVADSPSELAAQMREVIRGRLVQGETPEAITAYFVSRYGDWILLEPPRRGLGWIVWGAPLLLFLLGVAAAARFIRRTAPVPPP